MPHCTVSRGSSGIVVRQGQTTIALDPSRQADCDITFVSHAHVDHLHKRSRNKNAEKKSQVIASKETCLIAGARGYCFTEPAECWEGLELVDTGHILGSRGLLVGDSMFYTGDISTRQRAFMKPARMPRAETLIIESTFGRPEYVFPKLTEVEHKTNKIISENYDLGRPVILMGYALGKAQLLTKLFDHWDPLYVHDSVATMNSVYSELGVKFKDVVTCSQAEQQGLLAKERPWIMVAPLMSGRSAFVRDMKARYNAVTVGFSGWATGERYRYMMGLDYAIPMSDHCDYNELVDAVKKCAPSRVYTFHGFAKEFARSLRKMGFDARAVDEDGHPAGSDATLDSFQ
ncbi:MAG: exonuclease [Nitrososphaera sp.]